MLKFINYTNETSEPIIVNINPLGIYGFGSMDFNIFERALSYISAQITLKSSDLFI